MSCCINGFNTDIRNFKLKDYYLDSISSKLKPAENWLRHEVMEKILDGVVVNEDEKLRELEEKNILSIRDHLVKSVYPVSAERTDKEVCFDDTKGYAMCAIDAIGFHFTFKKDIVIKSKFKCDGSEIKLKVTDEGIEILEGGEFYILYPNLKNCDNWSDHCCLHMHFFKSCESMEEYIKKADLVHSDIIALNREQAFTVANWIFGE